MTRHFLPKAEEARRSPAGASMLSRLSPLSVDLSRNWWWKLLSGNELEVQRIGFFFKPFNALQSELLLVMFDTFLNVFVPIAQHTINEPSEMMGHSDDSLGSAESGSQTAIFGSQRALAVGEALGTKSKGVSGSVVDLARGST